MAERLGEAVLELRTDDSKLGKGIDNAEKRAKALGRTFDEVGKKLQNVGTNITAFVTLPIIGLGAATLKMATDAVESENLFEVSFGNMAEAARSWSEETGSALKLNAFALREQSALIFAMTDSMGLSQDAAFGMATGITEMAGDMASFFNLKPEEAFDKLRAGIVGEAEPLRALGILIDEATVKQAAYTHGLVAFGDELTAVEKVQARWLAIQDQTVKVQGDLARTLDSPVNRMRALGTVIEENAIAIGIALLPALESLLDIADDVVVVVERWIEKFTSAAPATQNTVIAVVALAAALGPAVIGLGSLIRVVGFAIASFSGLSVSISGVWAAIMGPVGLVLAAIALLLAIKPVREFLLDFATSVLSTVVTWVKATVAAFGEWWVSTTDGRTFLAELAKVIAKDVIGAIAPLVKLVVKFTKNLAASVVSTVRATAQFLEWTGALDLAWAALKLLWGMLVNAVETFALLIPGMRGAIKQMKDWADKAAAAVQVTERYDVSVASAGLSVEAMDAATEAALAPVENLTGGIEDLGAAADSTAESLQEMLSRLAGEAAQRMKEHEQQIKDIAGEYEELAVDVLPLVVQEIGNVGEAAGDTGGRLIAGFRDGADAIKAIWEDVVADMAFQLVDGLLTGFESGELESIFANAGADLGGTFGQALGSRFGPIGSAIGQKLGSAIGKSVGKTVGKFFSKLFGKRDRVGEALKKFGLNISKELKKIIEQTAKDLGVQAESAMRLHLVDVMQEMGIESAEALASFAHLTELLLFDLERGLISSEQATIALGDSVTELLANFEDAGGGLSELNDIADIFTHTAAAVVAGQLSSAQATDILNDSFADFVDLAITMGDEGLDSINRIVLAAQNAGLEVEAITERLAEAMDEAASIMAERNAFLLDQSKALLAGIETLFAGVGGVTAREIEASAQSVVSAFSAMLAAGVPLSEALAEVGSAFEMITAKGVEDLPDEFQRLGEMIAILSDEALQGMISKIEGATSATMALGNMGLLTGEQFDVFGDRVDRTFKKLVDGGLTGEEALVALGPQLQLLNDLSQQYGFEIDNITSGLLEQAMAQGVVADKGLTTEDILIRGFDAMLEGVNALIVALGGIPLAFEKWDQATAETVAASTSGFSEISTTATGTAGEVGEIWTESANVVLNAWGQTTSAISDNVSSMVASFRRDFRNIPINFNVNFRGGGGPPLSFAHGSEGFVDFGTGSPAMLHGTEEVITAAQGVGIVGMVQAAIMDAGRASSRDGVLAELQEQTGLLVEAFDQRAKHHKVDTTNADKHAAKVRRVPFRSETPGTVC